MNIDKMRCTCKKCSHVFDAEIVVNCPISVAAASMEAVRCPKCHSSDCGLGGNYGDAPPPTAPRLDRARWWNTRGERGTSSNTIFWAFDGGMLQSHGHDIPYDPADYRRCRLLLDLFPEWRATMHVVSDRLPYWKPFVDAWDQMDALYDEEYPKGTAPKLYALMQGLVKQSKAIKDMERQEC